MPMDVDIEGHVRRIVDKGRSQKSTDICWKNEEIEIGQCQITDESFEEFSERVKTTLAEYPSKGIDKIIESMDKRMDLIIKAKGQCIKYCLSCLLLF